MQFFADGNFLGTDTTAPDAFTWSDVPAGRYTFTARSTNDNGASASSSPVSVTVQTSGG